MCGVIGLVLNEQNGDAAGQIVDGLLQLQHRGQDACGTVTGTPNGPVKCVKGQGLLSDSLLQNLSLSKSPASFGLGHVRYRTTGPLQDSETQPISSCGKHEIFLAHNGQVKYSGPPKVICSLGGQVTEDQVTSDSYFILATLGQAMEDAEPLRLDSQIVLALQSVYRHCSGSFACVAMIDTSAVLGFRDPHGIKPLILGQRQAQNGQMEYMLASESTALDKLDFEIVRDVRPGEAILISTSTSSRPRLQTLQIVPPRSYTPDIFELVYFARPESTLDGTSVHECRKRMGRALGGIVESKLGWEACSEIDCVIPVPESGYVSALALSNRLRIPLALGFVKNGYCNRSFIQPEHTQRLKAVWRKLNVVKSEFEGKNVLIVDDSIVRGGTSRELVRMARKAGAKNVIFASSSPAIRFNHIYGIDLADPRALVAHGRTEDEVAEAIGADMVIYLPLKNLLECCIVADTQSPGVEGYEVGLFTGQYITERK